MRIVSAPLLALMAALAVAGCGGSGKSASTSTSTSTVTRTVTVTQPATGGGASTAVSGQTTAAGAQNLVVTDAIRSQLLAAGAALHQLPVSDYTGLVRGQTFYALDPATGDHWAGAALIPSKSSQKAQIGNQDDGADLVFRRTGSGSVEGVGRGHSRQRHLHLRRHAAGRRAERLEPGAGHLPPP